MSEMAKMQVPAELGTVATEHPLIAMPFAAEIDGRHCLGEGLSLVRAEVAGLLDPGLDGQLRLVRLAFAFQGFSVVLGVQCKLALSQGRAILVFADPMGDHLPQLRHVLNAWIAGDLVALGSVLGVTSTKATARADAPVTWRDTVGRLVGTLLLGAATAGLLAGVGMLLIGRVYTADLPSPARIAPQGQVLSALAAGQIAYLNLDAAPGEVAFALSAQNGQVLSVTKTCDCVLTPLGPQVGATVQAGEGVLLAHASDAPLDVIAAVPMELLYALATADHVELLLADGQRMTATPAQPLTNATGSDPAALVPVRLIPDAALPASADGGLAQVTIVQPLPAFLKPLRALSRALGG